METPRERDDRLAAELRALRPAPSPEFAAKLDERAAACFPRRTRWPRLSLGSLRPVQPRRLLLAGGTIAVLVVLAASALIVANRGGFGPDDNLALLEPRKEQAATPPGSPHKAAAGAGQNSSEEASGVQYESDLIPMAESEASSGPVYGAASGEAANSSFDDSGRYTGGGPHLARLHHRAVEHSAEIVLGAAPDDVADDSAEVFEAVHAHDGIVMRSSTREGQPGQAGATFELLIPSAKLGDALAALSAIDEVRSRHEATDDITTPTVATGELLQDSKARIDSLLAQLEAAETESEREAVEAELAQERRHRSRLRGQLQHLERRADYSRVLLRIETGAEDESGTGGGTWGIGDALADAGQILAVAAAVAVVGLAILGPIALIALLAWLTHRAWVRRERRRVLS
ncbi:MAG: DUF4349 domain-containing protein [Solirubrobacterales bacterium]